VFPRVTSLSVHVGDIAEMMAPRHSLLERRRSRLALRKVPDAVAPAVVWKDGSQSSSRHVPTSVAESDLTTADDPEAAAMEPTAAHGDINVMLAHSDALHDTTSLAGQVVLLQEVVARLEAGEERQQRLDAKTSELIELVENLTACISSLGKNSDQKAEPDNDDADDDFESKPESSYSLCVTLCILSERPSDVACAVALQLVLCTLATLFSFGFYDAAYIESYLLEFPTFAPPISMGSVYTGRTISFCGGLDDVYYDFRLDEDGCAVIPTINVLTSIGGLIFLAFQCRDDDMQTFLTPHPLAYILSASPPPQRPRNDRARPPMTWWRGVALAAMQLAWLIRFLLVPVLVMSGSAIALGSSVDAVGTVLYTTSDRTTCHRNATSPASVPRPIPGDRRNAMAAGFIFDLDEVLYEQVAPARWRNAYQASSIHSTAFHEVSHFWKASITWSLYAVTLGFSLVFYVMFVGPVVDTWQRPQSNWYFWLQMFMHARAGVFVLAQVCLFFTHGARSTLHVGDIGRNHPRAISALHCTLLVIGAAASSYFCFQLCYRWGLDELLGSTSVFGPLAGSEMWNCLMGTADCQRPQSLSGWTENQTEVYATYTYESTWYGAG